MRRYIATPRSKGPSSVTAGIAGVRLASTHFSNHVRTSTTTTTSTTVDPINISKPEFRFGNRGRQQLQPGNKKNTAQDDYMLRSKPLIRINDSIVLESILTPKFTKLSAFHDTGEALQFLRDISQKTSPLYPITRVQESYKPEELDKISQRLIDETLSDPNVTQVQLQQLFFKIIGITIHDLRSSNAMEVHRLTREKQSLSRFSTGVKQHINKISPMIQYIAANYIKNHKSLKSLFGLVDILRGIPSLNGSFSYEAWLNTILGCTELELTPETVQLISQYLISSDLGDLLQGTTQPMNNLPDKVEGALLLDKLIRCCSEIGNIDQARMFIPLFVNKGISPSIISIETYLNAVNKALTENSAKYISGKTPKDYVNVITRCISTNCTPKIVSILLNFCTKTELELEGLLEITDKCQPKVRKQIYEDNQLGFINKLCSSNQKGTVFEKAVKNKVGSLTRSSELFGLITRILDNTGRKKLNQQALEASLIWLVYFDNLSGAMKLLESNGNQRLSTECLRTLFRLLPLNNINESKSVDFSFTSSIAFDKSMEIEFFETLISMITDKDTLGLYLISTAYYGNIESLKMLQKEINLSVKFRHIFPIVISIAGRGKECSDSIGYLLEANTASDGLQYLRKVLQNSDFAYTKNIVEIASYLIKNRDKWSKEELVALFLPFKELTSLKSTMKIDAEMITNSKEILKFIKSKGFRSSKAINIEKDKRNLANKFITELLLEMKDESHLNRELNLLTNAFV